MKQTFKRVLSVVLSLLMIVSMLSAYTMAKTNYEPDDEYYDRAYLDSVIVSTSWTKCSEGDPISYKYRGKTIEEKFDPEVHFTTLQAAYDYCLEVGQTSPSIVVLSGMHSGNLVIKTSVTILGANAGINPNDVNEDDPTAPWGAAKRETETVLRGVIEVDPNTNVDTDVVIDGVFLYSGFAYVDLGANPVYTTVSLKNTNINAAGSTSYNSVSVTKLLFLEKSTNKSNSVYIKNVRATNMTSANIIGAYADVIEVDGLYYEKSSVPAIVSADANTDQNPEYVVKNSMFYNNKSKNGVINIDSSLKDGTKRLFANLEVFDCWFIDDTGTPTTDEHLGSASPIQCTLIGSKNSVNIHDCVFKGISEYTAPAVKFTYAESAYTGVVNNVKVNNNMFYGYCAVPSTEGLNVASRIDYSDNYFADSKNVQCDPSYPDQSSVTGVDIEYYWLDEAKTMRSDSYNITSIGIPDSIITHHTKEITATIEYGKSYDVSFVTLDEKTVYTLYDMSGEVVTKLDSTKLISGDSKNVYYAVGTNPGLEGYEVVYDVVISTYDPDKSVLFDVEGQYMLSTATADMKKGDVFYCVWDDVLYEFIVGETVFSDIKDIYAVSNGVPTVLIPAGVHNSDIKLAGSVVLLGAKHGTNPNVPQFESPDVAWAQNPDRINADQETVLEDCVVYIADDVANATVTLDGFTFGNKSGYYDRGENTATFTTSIIKNVIVDGAGDGFFFNETLNAEVSMPHIFTFATGADTFTVNHKNIRFVNVRMTDQGTYCFTGDHFETIVFDGFYYANNTSPIFDVNWRASAKQNFYMEVRNSNFYKNTTTVRVIGLDFTKTNASSAMYNRLVLNNNIFFDTSTYSYGIIGIIFASSRDSLKFTNNLFFSSVCDSIMPGNTNWFLGKTIIPTPDADGKTEYEPETVNDVDISYNRIFGCTQYVNQATCVDDGLCWDYSYNFFSGDKKYSKTAKGAAPATRSGTASTCFYYFTDYNMTTLKASTAGGDKTEFENDLKYRINGLGKLDTTAKTYTDSVPAYANTYDFGIVLDTDQAKYGIYSNEACTKAVAEPVNLVGGENVFYIKFASFNGSVSEIYKATINKAYNTGAIITRFGNDEINKNGVSAVVPVGTTTYTIPAVEVSAGASYKVYDDAACTTEFTATAIDNISATPVVKYVKVTSEDGKATKVYALSVVQSDVKQGALISIDNAERVSATEFKAVIPGNVTYFSVNANCSEGATAEVYLENKPVLVINSTYTVDNVITSRTAKVVVTSESGVKTEYTLVVEKDATSCEVDSIYAMAPYSVEDACFEADVSTNLFEVNATLINPAATYAVYSDRDCTKLCANNIIKLTSGENVAYMKVTSADGLSSKLYTLKFKYNGLGGSSEGITNDVYSVVDAELEPTTGIYCIAAGDNISEYELKFELLDSSYDRSTYTLYADNYKTAIKRDVSITSSTNLKVSTMSTLVYVEVRLSDGAGSSDIVEKFRVLVESPRPKVTYKDSSSIASWAQAQVNYLNDNGAGFFEGDEKGNFNPKNNITRFEVAAIAVRVLGVNADNFSKVLLPFKDNIPSWAENYVKACYSLGIMNGVSATEFNGSASTTRQEFAKTIVSVVLLAATPDIDAITLYNAGKETIDAAYNAMNFADDSDVATWAVPYIRLAVSTFNLMNGSSENGKLYVNPKKPITRQEVAVLLANYHGYTA